MIQQRTRHEQAHNTYYKAENKAENQDYRIYRTHDKNYTYGHELGQK